MTPPDSGERCPWSGYTDNNLSGQCSLRRGHGGPHEIAQPDSGEREVVKRWETLHGGHTVACEEAAHQRECICGLVAASVSLPLSLAQRILAALEEHARCYPQPNKHDALAAELRAYIADREGKK